MVSSAVNMVPLAVVALILFAGSAYSESDRIVGGWPTTVEKWPSIVQVDSLSVWSGVWSHSCGGNILTNYHILSAAHCFDGSTYSPSNRRIRAGTSFRNTGGVIVYVEREFNHPSYGSANYDGDLSVIKLLTPLEFSPVIQQGLYPPQGFSVADNSSVFHAGWGTIRPGGPTSFELLETEIYTINNNLCSERYQTLNRPVLAVTENMICAGLLDVGGRDACQGDSGGPLYYNDGTQDIIIGLVSWGWGCADPVFPGVSTRISSYTDWIVATASS